MQLWLSDSMRQGAAILVCLASGRILQVEEVIRRMSLKQLLYFEIPIPPHPKAHVNFCGSLFIRSVVACVQYVLYMLFIILLYWVCRCAIKASLGFSYVAS